MARRIHVARLQVGEIALTNVQAHHARDVLRLPDGAVVDVFDDAGAQASGSLRYSGEGDPVVIVAAIDEPSPGRALQWTVAAAVPKGDRADWMVEKLSELGATAFIPLAAVRSVVLPEGKNKRERWARLAMESAKQCRRVGVMKIGELTTVQRAIEGVAPGAIAWFLATEVEGLAMREAVDQAAGARAMTLFIGPEGGWDATEIAAFSAAGFVAVRLGETILRIETAAVAAGAVVTTLLS